MSMFVKAVTIREDDVYSSPSIYALDNCGRIWVSEPRNLGAWKQLKRPNGCGAKKHPGHLIMLSRQVMDLFVWACEGTNSVGALDTSGTIWIYRWTIQGDMWDHVDGPDFEEVGG